MTAQNILNALRMPTRRVSMMLAAALLFASPLFLLPVTVYADDPPQNVTATAGDESILVEWGAPEDTENLLGFEIRYREQPGSPGVWPLPVITDLNDQPDADSFLVEGLTNGTTYAFQVRALYDAETEESQWCCGAGEASGTLATATPFGNPSVPQNFSAEPGDEQVVLTWNAPADDNGKAVVSYLVEIQESEDGNWEEADVVGAPTTTTTITNLENRTSYDFRISAYNGTWYDDTESYSNTVQANEVTPFTVPNAPENLTATPDNQQVGLEWQAPSNDGGRTVTGYVIEYKLASDSDDPENWEEETTASTEITISGLINGEEYDFRVSAENEAGVGDYADISATPSSVPSVPQNLSAAAGDKQVALTWEAPDDDGGFPITEYIVEYKLTADDDTAWTDIDHDSDETQATITGLTNGTAYDFRVTAVTSEGNGSPASVVNVIPFTDVPNDGDANGDGIDDSLQAYVDGMVNPVTGAYAVLEADPACTVDELDVNASGIDDPGFAYPVGLMDFTLDCGTPGFTTTVKQYYYGSYDSALVVARKLRADNSYVTIAGATAENVTIGGQQVLTLTFQITDGSELDNDGDANGTIVDPSGPALNTAGVPNTGLGGNQAKQSGWRNLFGLPVLLKW